jgi:hypothetical protein
LLQEKNLNSSRRQRVLQCGGVLRSTGSSSTMTMSCSNLLSREHLKHRKGIKQVVISTTNIQLHLRVCWCSQNFPVSVVNTDVENWNGKPPTECLFRVISSFYFVFGRSRILISAWRPVILTEVCRGFPQSFHENAWIFLKIGPWQFPSSPFQSVIYFSYYNSSYIIWAIKRIVK